MKREFGFSTVVSRLRLALLFLALAGTDRCTESYSLGAQTEIATETPTASETASETPSASPTETPEGATATPTLAATATATIASGLVGLFRELAALPDGSAAANNAAHADPGCTKARKDWLGHIYTDEEVAGVSLDTDGDGYTDKLESDFGTDPRDPASHPTLRVTRLADRMQGFDDDMDGLSNDEEARLKTDPNSADTDGDGASDGAEVLSGTNPRDPLSRPSDSDGDGLSDDYEAGHGLNMQSSDTDNDGLRDDQELALGTNPLVNDTDGDGILDGKEYETGSDPLIPEAPTGKCP